MSATPRLELVNSFRSLSLSAISGRVCVELKIHQTTIASATVTRPRVRCVGSADGLTMYAGDAGIAISQREAWEIREWLSGGR